MALYTATYTEANTITFDVEVPDGMPVDEAYEWLMDHWDETVVPHLDTREMTLVENGLDAVQPATTSVRNAAGNQASYPPSSTASNARTAGHCAMTAHTCATYAARPAATGAPTATNTRCSAPTTGAATSSAPNAPNSSVRKSVGEYRETNGRRHRTMAGQPHAGLVWPLSSAGPEWRRVGTNMATRRGTIRPAAAVVRPADPP